MSEEPQITTARTLAAFFFRWPFRSCKPLITVPKREVKRKAQLDLRGMLWLRLEAGEKWGYSPFLGSPSPKATNEAFREGGRKIHTGVESSAIRRLQWPADWLKSTGWRKGCHRKNPGVGEHPCLMEPKKEGRLICHSQMRARRAFFSSFEVAQALRGGYTPMK